MAHVIAIHTRDADDDLQPRGTAKLLAPKVIAPGNGFDDMGTYHRLAVVGPRINRPMAIAALKQTLQDAFTDQCWHSRDCCGCKGARVTVKHRGGRVYSVISRHSRNY